MSINVADQSEAAYGVFIGNRFQFVTEDVFQFFNNYKPAEDQEEPDWFGEGEEF